MSATVAKMTRANRFSQLLSSLQQLREPGILRMARLTEFLTGAAAESNLYEPTMKKARFQLGFVSSDVRPTRMY